MSGHADTIRSAGLPYAAAEYDALVATVEQQADRIAWLEGDVAGWRIKLTECQTENQQLRDALDFYADRVNYENATPRMVRPVIADRGAVARAALDATRCAVPGS
jgi:hypothetical protein